MQGIVIVLGLPRTTESRSFLRECFPGSEVRWCDRAMDIGAQLRDVCIAPTHLADGAPAEACSFLVVNFAALAEHQRLALRKLLSDDLHGILCVGVSPSPDDCLPALASGARAFLVLDEPAGDQRRAIRSAVNGSVRLSARCADALVRQAQRLPTSPESLSAKLSPREQEILRMLSSGATVPEAARSVGVSRHTAYTYVRRLYQKLGVRTRVELARLVR